MGFKRHKNNKALPSFSIGCLALGLATSTYASDFSDEREIIITPKAGVESFTLEQQLKAIDTGIDAGKEKRYQRFLDRFNTRIATVKEKHLEKKLAQLQRHPLIESAEVNEMVDLSATPNDPKYGNAWHLRKMNVDKVWSTTTGNNVVVAVLDTGVDEDHPDLINNLLPGYNAVSNNSDLTDTHGHGTKVSGVIAATSNNNQGVTSIAWDSKILPIKVSERSDGVASFLDIADALVYAADNGADIANISYRVTQSSTVTNAAKYFYEKGGLVVAAAGNSGEDQNCSDNQYIITVSATTSKDALARWSNYGNCMDVAAPGSGIQTTTKNGGYGSVSGTSFAAPATAAVLALLKEKNPKLSNAELESLLEANADTSMFSGEFSNKFGHGRVDAYAAVFEGVYVPEPEQDTSAPTVYITTPVHNQNVSDSINVSVNAVDNVGVTAVELYFRGNLFATDNNAPYEFNIDASKLADGAKTLYARAIDAAGNVGESDEIIVNLVSTPEPEPVPTPEPDVSNDTTPPTVYFVTPTEYEEVTGTVNISLEAYDDNGIDSVEVYFRNSLLKTLKDGPYELTINVGGLRDGNKTLKAVAYDKAGNKTDTGNYYITVNKSLEPTTPEPEPEPEPEPTPDPEPEVPEPTDPSVDTVAPQVTFVTPVANQTVSGVLDIEIDASDDQGLDYVQLYFRGRASKLFTEAPFTHQINISNLRSGEKTLEAVAFDKAGNSTTTLIKVNVK
ncbi:S8 family serine peptidase [Thalassotalea sp. PS06]|uniref:S8 family serine peptidase n=1 Tax=Thalassotalea sp. PS06 TaxID=2594005 RepID=UPI00116278A4|nr:S8 family serine peptidase [Thalassotalea sp. PS06]QDP01015.1 S8 family serine peptidase [Thalassotalea sp. PS06]